MSCQFHSNPVFGCGGCISERNTARKDYGVKERLYDQDRRGAKPKKPACGHVFDEVKNGRGAVIAWFCMRCRESFVLVPCMVCEANFEKNIKSRARFDLCSSGCRAKNRIRLKEKKKDAEKQTKPSADKTLGVD